VSTGELYAQPLPLTHPTWCNDQEWHYPGPSVAIVDANTYSSGDLFAAGWVDHAIGSLVSIGQATGAGGANVWTSHQLRDAIAGTDQSWPAMPGGAGFTIAFRRAIRSAAGDGIPIEDLGIPGLPYEMTRTDCLTATRICWRSAPACSREDDDERVRPGTAENGMGPRRRGAVYL
jgi:hypothetical protein